MTRSHKKQSLIKTFFNTLNDNNNKNDIPYPILIIDIIKYNLCPACRPDEFENYNIIHNPEYHNRSIMICACGRNANRTNVFHGCTHCTCMNSSAKIVYSAIENYKIQKKLENDRKSDILYLNQLYTIL